MPAKVIYQIVINQHELQYWSDGDVSIADLETDEKVYIPDHTLERLIRRFILECGNETETH